MKQIKIDGKEINLECRPYSLTLYSREFEEKDLVEDAMKLVKGYQEGKINATLQMQIVWCFAKTAKMKENVRIFPSFEDWLMGFEYLNMSNSDDQMALVELINGSLFREEKEEQPESEQQSGE